MYANFLYNARKFFGIKVRLFFGFPYKCTQVFRFLLALNWIKNVIGRSDYVSCRWLAAKNDPDGQKRNATQSGSNRPDLQSRENAQKTPQNGAKRPKTALK